VAPGLFVELLRRYHTHAARSNRSDGVSDQCGTLYFLGAGRKHINVGSAIVQRGREQPDDQHNHQCLDLMRMSCRIGEARKQVPLMSSATNFTPDTPLGQDVQSLLLSHTQGLTLQEIRRHLRREKGRHVSEANLQALLKHSIFVALSDGRYVLEGAETPAVTHLSANDAQDEQMGSASNAPLIGNLPLAHSDYVVFDL
jgi:hypothetical protein